MCERQANPNNPGDLQDKIRDGLAAEFFFPPALGIRQTAYVGDSPVRRPPAPLDAIASRLFFFRSAVAPTVPAFYTEIGVTWQLEGEGIASPGLPGVIQSALGKKVLAERAKKMLVFICSAEKIRGG
ncbi:hypothetical protein Trydic_g23209 [Trypoxylus dichotomus]